MGKKAKYKEAKRFAASLQPMTIGRAIGKRLTGEELIKEGTTKLTDGKDVLPEVNYKKIQVVNMPVNHQWNAKKLFKKYGAAGLLAYQNKIQQVIEKSQKQNATT